MPHPLRFLFGYVRHRIPRESAADTVELCRKSGFVYRNFVFLDDGATFDCSYNTSKRLIAECIRAGIEIEIERRYGIAALAIRYRHRYGIALGILAFLFITLLSGSIVWDVRVMGNDRLEDGEVIAVLEECGMGVGSVIGRLDTAVIENRVLIASDEISWISINMAGCVAEVEIREAVPEPEDDGPAAADLVASRDGVIDLFENTRGNVSVSIGDAVKQGDVLVGGRYFDEDGNCTRYTVARGQVLARTSRAFEVEIPLDYEKKVYTGEVKREKYLIFFKKQIKIFGNCGNLDRTCDTIDMIEYFELFGGIRLPIGVRTVTRAEYRYEVARRDELAAMELARYRLRCVMESEVPNGMLLRKRLRAEPSENLFRLSCSAEYIENIAVTREIEIDGIP